MPFVTTLRADFPELQNIFFSLIHIKRSKHIAKLVTHIIVRKRWQAILHHMGPLTCLVILYKFDSSCVYADVFFRFSSHLVKT